MTNRKNLNVSLPETVILDIRKQAADNKRTIKAELELILVEYFQSKQQAQTDKESGK